MVQISDRISEIFAGEKIFITGGTGFMGKVFLEHLLRLTKIDKIFLLVREKKNKMPSERVKEIFQNILFSSLIEKISLESILEKVYLIQGDCSESKLSLSNADREILSQNITMIFHFAATVRFTEKFQKAISLNVRGTFEMLELARECKNLKLFCHLSTAYCHLDQKNLFETSYAIDEDPMKIIEMAEKLTEDEVENFFKKKLCSTIPNSYVFTKGVAEKLVEEFQSKYQLPVLICRPAIVTQSYAQPLAGWTDSYNGAVGLVVAGCMGMMRTMHATGEDKFNIVPVDYSIQNVMAATWNYFERNYETNGVSRLQFVNLICFPTALAHFTKTFIDINFDYFLGDFVWVPRVTFISTRWIYKTRVFLVQWLPSLIIDTILGIFKKKSFLLNAQKRIATELDVLRTFYTTEWTFDTSALNKIHKKMTTLELERYSTLEFDFEEYSKNCILGIREYLMKQKEEDIPRTRRRAKLYLLADNVLKMALCAYFFYLVISVMSSIYN